MPDNHKVGYKRPPKTGQFQKGKSGNPKGRPKNTRKLCTICILAYPWSQKNAQPSKLALMPGKVKGSNMDQKLVDDARAGYLLLRQDVDEKQIDEVFVDSDSPSESAGSKGPLSPVPAPSTAPPAATPHAAD